MRSFEITRVVTKDLITDSFQGLRNLFGMRLRGYETLLKRNIDEMMNQMNDIHSPKWFRLIVNPLTNGSAMIILYGEENE